jgi:transaldolase
MSVESHPYLELLKKTGSDLWIDSGDKEKVASLWKSEITACTTNNTLANQVVQSGVMDDEIKKSIADIKANDRDCSEENIVMEVGFKINCKIAMRLVDAFDSKVSVELHPAFAHDKEATIKFARRYYQVCPKHFIVKIPLTPEGYLAVHELSAEGMPINFTLGFSARQNYLAARLSNPTYTNVFLGRLNAVVSDNKIGDGKFVGEKVLMATQRILNSLKNGKAATQTSLIGASIRSGEQLLNIAGADVLTIPPKALEEFLAMDFTSTHVENRVDIDPEVVVNSEYAERFRVLWDVDEDLRKFVDKLLLVKVGKMDGDDLVKASEDCDLNLFHRFKDSEVAKIKADGKIPKLGDWDKSIGVDDLMTQSALQSFATDQEELDNKIRGMI